MTSLRAEFREQIGLGLIRAQLRLRKRPALEAVDDARHRKPFRPAQAFAGVPGMERPCVGQSRMTSLLLDLLAIRLSLSGPAWPPAIPADAPLAIVANHPFGIGDGIVILALAEQLGRPFRVLINSDFLKIPEIRPLPCRSIFPRAGRRPRPIWKPGTPPSAR
jgi:hypothetical protein